MAVMSQDMSVGRSDGHSCSHSVSHQAPFGAQSSRVRMTTRTEHQGGAVGFLSAARQELLLFGSDQSLNRSNTKPGGADSCPGGWKMKYVSSMHGYDKSELNFEKTHPYSL